MHTALLFTLGLGSVFVVLAGAVTVMALRRAPEGVETVDGFQVIGATVQPRNATGNSGGDFSGALGALSAQ